METTRRTFIRQAACAALTTTGILNTIFDLRRLSAAPLDASGYKALVCLFLYGGNDANNRPNRRGGGPPPHTASHLIDPHLKFLVEL